MRDVGCAQAASLYGTPCGTGFSEHEIEVSRRHCIRIVCSRRRARWQDAEDAVNEAITRLLDDGLGINEMFCLPVVYRAFDALRRERRWQSRHSVRDVWNDAAPSGPDDAPTHEEDMGILGAGLSTLNPRTHRVVMLRVHGFTWTEIGDTIGTSHTSARNIFFKGLASLRVELVRQGLAV